MNEECATEHAIRTNHVYGAILMFAIILFAIIFILKY